MYSDSSIFETESYHFSALELNFSTLSDFVPYKFASVPLLDTAAKVRDEFSKSEVHSDNIN